MLSMLKNCSGFSSICGRFTMWSVGSCSDPAVLQCFPWNSIVTSETLSIDCDKTIKTGFGGGSATGGYSFSLSGLCLELQPRQFWGNLVHPGRRFNHPPGLGNDRYSTLSSGSAKFHQVHSRSSTTTFNVTFKMCHEMSLCNIMLYIVAAREESETFCKNQQSIMDTESGLPIQIIKRLSLQHKNCSSAYSRFPQC